MHRTVNVLFYVSKPVFNLFEVEEFPHFDKSNSSFLRRNLLINQFEVVSTLDLPVKITALFHQFDISAEGLDELQRFENLEIVFYEEGNQNQIIREILEDTDEAQNLIIAVNPLVMGLKPQDYVEMVKQVELEDETTFLIRSQNGYLSAVAFNYMESKQSDLLLNILKPYDKLLHQILMLNSRPITGGFAGTVVKSTKDFKLLYEYLSAKESIPACSFMMHDRFTELFVEYKELL
ncbi:MAG: hypothetical protein LCH52_02930 [Bacteroidetes bacterium]|nr:hypothetical protein [Bacteroidota bacterium]